MTNTAFPKIILCHSGSRSHLAKAYGGARFGYPESRFVFGSF